MAESHFAPPREMDTYNKAQSNLTCQLVTIDRILSKQPEKANAALFVPIHDFASDYKPTTVNVKYHGSFRYVLMLAVS